MPAKAGIHLFLAPKFMQKNVFANRDSYLIKLITKAPMDSRLRGNDSILYRCFPLSCPRRNDSDNDKIDFIELASVGITPQSVL